MKTKSILALFLGVVFFSSVVFAAVQEKNVQTQDKARKVTRENIITLMLLRMTRFLELTEEQTAKIYPFFNRIEKEKMQINQQIRRQMREIREALSAEDPDPEVLKAKIQALKELRDALKNKDTEMEKCLEENLTVIQQAKYMVFMNAFFNELRDSLNRARTLRERTGPKKKKEL
jgi:Spy/CpxP family protein refolding chaperone